MGIVLPARVSGVRSRPSQDQEEFESSGQMYTEHLSSVP